MINCQKFLPVSVKTLYHRLVSCWLVIRQKYLEETEIQDGEPQQANCLVDHMLMITFSAVCRVARK